VNSAWAPYFLDAGEDHAERMTNTSEVTKSKKRFGSGLLALAAFGMSVVGVTANPTLAAAAAAGDGIWVGSPVTGSWPDTQGCSGKNLPTNCSKPSVHHRVYTSMFDTGPRLSDFAVDLQSVTKDQPVRLYAAAQYIPIALSAKVDKVGPACGSKKIADGGSMVTVGLYAGATKVGTVTYAHINPTVTAGQSLGTWGAQVGTVGSGYNKVAGCWTGMHVHVELANRQNFACYNGSYTSGSTAAKSSQLAESKVIGFVGGSFASRVQQPCP
jgi:hypothetical protein